MQCPAGGFLVVDDVILIIKSFAATTPQLDLDLRLKSAS
jgi:hypothetical protein